MTYPTPDMSAEAPHPNEPGSASETLAEAGRDLRDQAETKASEIRDTAADHVRARAESTREDIAKEVSSVGEALRRATEELRSGSAQERVFGQMATSLAEVADAISGRDVPQLIEDLEGFGRRNPMAFLGGAALLGFAGVRMARASRKHPERTGQVESHGSSSAGTGQAGTGATFQSPYSAPSGANPTAGRPASPTSAVSRSGAPHMSKEGPSNG